MYMSLFSYDEFRTNEVLHSTVSLLFDQRDPILINEYMAVFDQFIDINLGVDPYKFIGAEIVRQLEYDAIKVNISDYIDIYVTTTQIPAVSKYKPLHYCCCTHCKIWHFQILSTYIYKQIEIEKKLKFERYC